MPNPTAPAATPTTPKTGGAVPLDNYLLDKTIVAKPLTGQMDIFGTLKPKNPNVVLRGIFNGRSGDSQMSLRYEQAKGQGYVNATIEDIAGTVPVSMQRDGGKVIVHGDLILMKIDRATYMGALKYKDQQALRSVQRQRDSSLEHGQFELARAMQEVAAPQKLSRKLSPFIPTESELKKDFGAQGE